MSQSETKQPNAPQLKSFCKITIDYEDSIRSIDLENLLVGIRMLCEYELSEKSGMSPRTFSSVTKIQSIEKGSIDFFLIFDLMDTALNINDIYSFINNNGDHEWIDYVNFLQDLIGLYQNGKNIAENKEMYKKKFACIKKILTALPHFTSLKIQGKNSSIKLESEKEGEFKMTTEPQDNNQ